jgi:uncharacterized protein (TIGR02996 family)
MMTTRESLFQAILDDPDDLSIRLIFADWLEEHGGEIDRARAELIRRQCRMADLVPHVPEWVEHNAAVQDLLEQYRRDWNGPLHERLHRGGLLHAVAARRCRVKPWEYRRGFVEALHLQTGTFARHAEVLFRIGPIRHLKLWNVHFKLDQLVRCPLLDRVTTLDLADDQLGDRDAHVLASCEHLANLRNLYLGDNALSDRGIQTLKNAFPDIRIHRTGWAEDYFPRVRGPFVAD